MWRAVSESPSCSVPVTLGINPFSRFSQANGCITELYCDLNLHLWLFTMLSTFSSAYCSLCVCFSKVLHLLSGPFVSWKPKNTVCAHPGCTAWPSFRRAPATPSPAPISPPTWILDKRTLRFPTLVSRPHCLTQSWPTSLPLCRALHHPQFLLSPSQPALPHRCSHQDDQRCYGGENRQTVNWAEKTGGQPSSLTVLPSILAFHQADLQLRRDRS